MPTNKGWSRRFDEGDQPAFAEDVRPRAQEDTLGEPKEEGRMTVWIYIDTSKKVGDVDHLRSLHTCTLAETWLEENDPERVAFEYVVRE
jgi:hypothetical protein